MAETTRVTVNLHAGLAGRLAVRADRERRSLSSTVALLLEEALAAPSGVEQAGVEIGGGEPGAAGSAEKRPVRVAPTDPVDEASTPSASPPAEKTALGHRARKSVCEHRIPADQYCKQCDR